MTESAIYIHIPFCDHKCIYCDFYSIITEDNVKPYLVSLKKEIKYYSHLFSKDRVFSSIYFGGGTPSLMEPKYIDEIISFIKDNFKILPAAEITLETNPGTLDAIKLMDFYNIGINRISIGIQSFNDDDLKFLTRIHNKDLAVKTVMDAKDIGFYNINIDLIFNLPGQTKEKWKSNLIQAIQLPITHLSAYSLILERGTILNKMVIDGKIKIQDEDFDAELYELCMDFMQENNFIQYEVSNFAKPGFECIHNNAYWRYKDYLGLGTSSHSFMDSRRWWNYSSLKRYISEVEKNNHAAANSELINKAQMLNEYIMLALRSSGLNLDEFEKKFGIEWLVSKKDYLNQLSEKKFISIDENHIKLTKSGYAVCDEILTNIL